LARDPIYQLKVEHEGYVSWSAIVDLRGRDGDRINAILRPRPRDDETGYLLVRSTRQAAVYLNGREIGGVTNDKIPVKPGKYDVTLVNPRATSKPSTAVVVARGSTVSVNLPFK
jgi:hypothetical protein